MTHPNQEISILPLQRLTRLYDSLEQIEDDGWDDDMSDHDSHDGYSDGLWLQDDKGIWRYEKGRQDDDEWEETDEEVDDSMNVDMPWAEDETSPIMDDTVNLLPRNVTPDIADSTSPLLVSPSSTPPDVGQVMEVEGDEKLSPEDASDFTWKRFDILPTAPVDHAFYTTSRGQPSRAFLSRLTKEYRALSTSLPGMYSLCLL